MNIGVKYCGGCNPTFSRRKLVEKIIDEFKDINFETIKENCSYYIVLIVCGCLSACVNCNHIISKHKIVITSENDYVKAIDTIKSLYNNL